MLLKENAHKKSDALIERKKKEKKKGGREKVEGMEESDSEDLKGKGVREERTEGDN